MKMLDWGSVKYALMQHVNIFSNRHLAINYRQLTYMYIHDIQDFTVETISVFKAVGGGGAGGGGLMKSGLFLFLFIFK